MEKIIAKEILKANDQLAEINKKLLDNAGVLGINVMGSPGSGKTTLLEALAKGLKSKLSFSVVEGDLATSRDAERLEALKVPSVQINTGGACHLDASMVSSALKNLNLEDQQLLFIENVGNLVCPASYQLGERLKMVVLSVTEGDDKVAKYPSMFQRIDLLVINKTDLLPCLEYNLETIRKDMSKISKEIPLFTLSAKTGEGVDEFISWLQERYRQFTKSEYE